MCVYAQNAFLVPGGGGQKKMLDPMGLELQMAVNLRVSVRNQTWVLWNSGKSSLL